MIIKLEQKYHFGVISKQQQHLLRQQIQRDGVKHETLSDIEMCDLYVEKCSQGTPSKQLLNTIDAFIESTYSGDYLVLRRNN